jgi:hypothetical protein
MASRWSVSSIFTDVCISESNDIVNKLNLNFEEKNKQICFSAHTLSRAAYSRLQGQGFPTIKTVNDKEAEVIDIRQTRFLDLQTEMADPMNCNQINLHFLSYFK